MNTKLSPAALLCVSILSGLGLFGGWYLVLSGSFAVQNAKYSASYSYVDGPMVLVMAWIEFALAAVGVAAILQQRQSSPWIIGSACAFVLITPILYLIVNGMV